MAYLGVKPAGITSATQVETDKLNVDNVQVDGNTISSTDTNGDITLDPNGTGDTIVASGNLAVGTSSPEALLHVDAATNKNFLVQGGTGDVTEVLNYSSSDGYRNLLLGGSVLRFETGAGGGSSTSEAARIDSSGNLLVGATTFNSDNVGVYAGSSGAFFATRDGNQPAQFNRLTSDGNIIRLQKDGSTVGNLGVVDGDRLFIATPDGADAGLRFDGDNGEISPCNGSGANKDNSIDLGHSSARFDDIFATNSTIQTSDQNEKEQIASLTTAEMTAAKAISKLFKTFKWQDKVAAKGNAARRHAGVIAQDVQTAMTDAGLNAADYAFWCSNTWYEADETYTDDDGVQQTRTNTYDTADDAPEGATERTRLGIRYPELLAFIGAATEQRLADIETRLTALEDA